MKQFVTRVYTLLSTTLIILFYISTSMKRIWSFNVGYDVVFKLNKSNWKVALKLIWPSIYHICNSNCCHLLFATAWDDFWGHTSWIPLIRQSLSQWPSYLSKMDDRLMIFLFEMMEFLIYYVSETSIIVQCFILDYTYYESYDNTLYSVTSLKSLLVSLIHYDPMMKYWIYEIAHHW